MLDNTLSNLTPLSISKQAKSSAKQAKAEPESFEDKVKKRKSSHISADAQLPAQSDGTLPPQLRSFSGPGKIYQSTAALEASHTKKTSKITVPPPLPPTLQSFKKMQRGKFVSQTFKPIADDEAGMDVSEPETESDLESLAGDDKIPTHANSEEDSASGVLREKFENFEIRRREHDEVDQEFDSRPTSEQLTSLRDALTRDPNLVTDSLTANLRMRLVKNEDDDEEAPSKRIKREPA